jgi:hypothetical protein
VSKQVLRERHGEGRCERWRHARDTNPVVETGLLRDSDARFEIWFPSPDMVSVWVETNLEEEPGPKREVLETWVFTAFAAGVIANLPKDAKKALSTRLADFPRQTSSDEIPCEVDDRSLVLPQQEGARKGFEGTFTVKGGLSVTKTKSHGFGLFGRDVQDCAQTATMALLLHLLLGFPSSSRMMLVEAARTLGNLGLAGAIGMTTHPHAAETALDRGVEAAEAAASGEEDGASLRG